MNPNSGKDVIEREYIYHEQVRALDNGGLDMTLFYHKRQCAVVIQALK